MVNIFLSYFNRKSNKRQNYDVEAAKMEECLKDNYHISQAIQNIILNKVFSLVFNSIRII